MKHVNKAILLGNVGADPRIGNGVARFRLATNRTWKDRDGQPKERTTWTTCVAFGKLAEIVEKYVAKGQPVHVIGYAESRPYEKDGVQREAYEIIIEDLVLLPTSESGERSHDRPEHQDRRNVRSSASSNRQEPAPTQGGGFADDDFDNYPL